MSTVASRTVAELAAAYRKAVEAKDYDALAQLYAEDAVQMSYSERNRPGSASTMDGREAIIRAFKEAPGDLEHDVSDVVIGSDAFASTLTCTYPSGQLVVSTSVAHVAGGQIAKQTGVETWDL